MVIGVAVYRAERAERAGFQTAVTIEEENHGRLKHFVSLAVGFKQRVTRFMINHKPKQRDAEGAELIA